jgi:hypothetical protein
MAKLIKPPKKTMGRPTIYTPELAALICDRVASFPHGIRYICNMFDDMPNPDTINAWRHKYTDFSDCYMEARRKQSHIMFESAIDEVQSISEYEYVNPKTGATCVDAGIVAMKKAIAFQKTHQAARISPAHYAVSKQSEETSPSDTLSKIQTLVADLNKTNHSDI